MTSKLAQLALDFALPQSWAEELNSSNRITLEAEDFARLTFKIWDVYQDVPGEFQLRIQIQGICDEAFQLLQLPEELKYIKEHPGYFAISGYVLVCQDEVNEVVLNALLSFSDWTNSNQGVKNPEGRPSLWAKASPEAIVQFIVEPYLSGKGDEILSFNGWAFEKLVWSGDGITSRPSTPRCRLVLPTVLPPVVPPVVLNRT
jgi:hypothetical protein